MFCKNYYNKKYLKLKYEICRNNIKQWPNSIQPRRYIILSLILPILTKFGLDNICKLHILYIVKKYQYIPYIILIHYSHYIVTMLFIVQLIIKIIKLEHTFLCVGLLNIIPIRYTYIMHYLYT